MYEECLYHDLNYHIKVHDVEFHDDDSDIIMSCEVDRIQSVARSIVSVIAKIHGYYKISSTTKNTKNLGYTKVFIHRKNNEE